jgi:hypothetical protein
MRRVRACRSKEFICGEEFHVASVEVSEGLVCLARSLRFFQNTRR